MKKENVLSVLLVFFSCQILAEGASKEQIKELLAVSGISRSMEIMEEQTLLGLAKEHVTDPENALSLDEQEIFMKQQRAEVLQANVISALHKTLSTDDIEYLIQLYRMKPMQKLLKAELHYITPDGARDLNIYFKGFLGSLPTKSRIELINDIVDASMEADQAVFILSAVTREKIKARFEYENRFNEEIQQKLEYQITAFKNNMESKIRKEMKLNYMFLCKDFSIGELESLYELLQDERRVKLQVAYTDALAQSLRKSVNAGIKAILRYRELPQT